MKDVEEIVKHFFDLSVSSYIGDFALIHFFFFFQKVIFVYAA